MKKKKVSKPRNAQATRQAILESARVLFAQLGYDAAGVREIAAGADVTAMMVQRYFGSKEQLFVAVLHHVMEQPVVLSDETLKSPQMAQRMAKAVVGMSDHKKKPLDGYSMMIRSLSNENTYRIARETMENLRQRSLADVLQGPLNQERAALMLAVVGGVQLIRQMVALPALANASPDALEKLLTRVFDVLIDPDLQLGMQAVPDSPSGLKGNPV